MSQLHKRFTSDQVKKLLDRYLKNEIERAYIQEILGIKRRRFFALLKQYKENPQHFTVQYRRTKASRTISPMIEQNILKELSIDKKIIQNKEKWKVKRKEAIKKPDALIGSRKKRGRDRKEKEIWYVEFTSPRGPKGRRTFGTKEEAEAYQKRLQTPSLFCNGDTFFGH